MSRLGRVAAGETDLYIFLPGDPGIDVVRFRRQRPEEMNLGDFEWLRRHPGQQLVRRASAGECESLPTPPRGAVWVARVTLHGTTRRTREFSAVPEAVAP